MAVGFYDDLGWHVLPYPRISLPVLLVVENALCAAWELLRIDARAGFNLLTASEDAITLELHEALFDRVFNSGVVEGFDSGLFATVEREPKIRSYDYGHLDKMPDLLVRLVGIDARAGFNLLTASEDAITLELHEALFDRVFNSGVEEGFDSGLFATVEREPKIRSY